MRFAAARPERTLFLRTSEDADEVARRVAAAIRQAAPQIMLMRAESVDAALAETVRPRQLHTMLFGSFAAAAVVLFGVGTFGAVAMSTASRSREIGVRIALGASAGRILRMVIAQNITPVVAGLLIGATASWWTTALLGSLIYGVAPRDPRLWTLSALFVLATALAATWLPAWKASRTDPQMVLKVQ